MEQKLPASLWIGAIIFILIMGFLFLPALMPKNDVQLAQYIFRQMVEGNERAMASIDWENFVTLGFDVGERYSKMSDEKARLSFAAAFVRNFSISFAQGSGRFADLVNWRLYTTIDGTTIVAADFPKKGQVVLFGIGRVDGKRKLVSMNWENEAPGAQEGAPISPSREPAQ